jgi:hypothetical protein
MQLHSAIIADQDLTFLIIAVPYPVLTDRTKAEQTVQFFQRRSVGLPVALVTRDSEGAPTAYFGRTDLAARLLQTPPAALRWQDFAIRH